MSLSRILNDDSVPPTLPHPPSSTTWSEQSPAPNPPPRVDATYLREPSPQESSISGQISPAHSLNDTNAPTSEVEPPPTVSTPIPEAPPAPTPQRGKGRSKAAKAAKDTTPSVSQSQQAGEDGAAAPKKRRKANTTATNANSEPKVTRTRRTSLRKAAKNKASLAMSPSGATSEPEIIIEQPLRPLTGEEVRLLSSDLEDCEEIWSGAIKDYDRETQKRRGLVVDWFETSEMEKNALTAQEMSHYYNTQISRIPLPPPPPPATHSISRHELRDRSPFAEYANGHDHEDAPRRRHKDNHKRYDSGAEDAALELERSVLGDFDDVEEVRSPPPKKARKSKTKESAKRPPSEAGSDHEAPPEHKDKPAKKKRKLENGSALKNESHDGSPASAVTHLKGVTRGNREGSVDSVSVSVSATPKGRKKGPKKKGAILGPDDIDLPASHPPSVAGDATPVVISRPGSPVPGTNGVIFELEENIPPLKKAKRMDDATMAKRVKSLEEAQKKVWTNIAKRDIAKVYKYQVSGHQARQSQMERIAKVASLQARRPFTKTAKAAKDTQAKAKRLMREMQVFWKKNEKEERDVRKREQKEASDRLKIEEEKREAARQARKLEFLISQTELYSHFVGSKLKTSEIEGEGENLPVPAGANIEDADPSKLTEINFDDEDETNLHRHARHNAQEAIEMARQRAQAFDAQAALDRKTNEALALAKGQAHIHDTEKSTEASTSSGPLVDLDSDELNFQNPTSLSGPLTIGQPKMLMAQLKEYQLKGLNWLGTLYEQGINGILADEMGLGKTVQSISLLAYLAETHDIWGPFLVVAPASTLHNWQQEITRFVPQLKALPYWGNVKDRATLRKFWSKKEISYNRDAPFHVLVTSYQLVTQDQQYFQRVKWQYMILDEAQNIKNSASVRWKTLLGFQCRNRLLLTGTPIQNSMQELWALLHFIMPSLFDSHDEFNEWFSKDIENAAENKGSKLNEHQLRRLHMILKPFMLRRVKRHVQNELSEKIEIDIYVDLSARQRALYNVLLSRVSVADLLAKAANFNDAESARSLMNLVMQFRKVCNHPELFERADVIAPFSFSKYGRSNASFKNEGDFVLLPYSSRNPIEFSIPKLFYLEGGLINVPQENSRNATSTSAVTKMFNIWSTDWIEQSLNDSATSSFSFLRFVDVGAGEAHALHRAPLIRRRLLAVQAEAVKKNTINYYSDSDFAASAVIKPFQLFPMVSLPCLATASQLPALHEVSTTLWSDSCLSRPGMKWFVPPVVAPPISIYCAERTFLDSQTQLLDAPVESLALYGLPPNVRDSLPASKAYHQNVPSIPPSGLFGVSPRNQIPMSPMQVPEAKRLIYDSAKLARLDALLHELKQGDHRVLVYFQMTRMMDLMEEYLIYRQYKYLRLDGSSKLEDRRDMVIDWQTRPDIFVFLLSTRAGGLGINLTAADTVIFYDHDWNPSNDAQAMDRAHRLGQTRQVTVYRLITKGTIDERIVQLARVKKDVQDIVVGNKNFTDVTKPSEIVQLLLNDEQLANLNTGAGSAPSAGEQKAANGVPQDLWNEDEDGFFGHSGPQSTAQDADGNGNSTPAPTTSGRGRKRKVGGTGAPRGRKPGKKKAGATEEPAAE